MGCWGQRGVGLAARRVALSSALLAVLNGMPLPAQSVPDGQNSSAPTASITQVLRDVEARYNRMKTMKAQFRQIVREGRRTVRQEQGTLYLSKPGRMRWEYTAPEAKLFLTAANRMILYLPAEGRVMQTSVNESDDLRAPLRFLLGRLDFAQEFQRFETLASLQPLEAGNIIFKTYPKRLAGQVDSMVFEIAGGSQIRRVVISEPGGTETEFRFTAEEANLAVAAEKFRFTPPPGTEMVYQ
jgi:outer membrane lipoprotein carrier protein